MKNKVIKLTLIILCFICMTGCGNKEESINKNEEIKYTHQDLLISSKYEKIDDFVNSLFNEINFDGKMTHASSNEQSEYITHAYINGEANTVFTFFFDYSEEFMFINIIYDKNNADSIDLTKKVINYSKFGFTPNEVNKINSIITNTKSTDDTKIGNYIISNLSNGNLVIKSKAKYGQNENSNSNNQETSNNSKPNSNSTTKPSNNSNQNNSTKPNNNSNQNNSTNTTSNSNNNSSNANQNTGSNDTTPNISVSKQNALKSAKSYLSVSAFSRKGLIEQLEYEKFSNEDAVYAVDNCGANWNNQALKSAKSYLNTSAFSYKGLKEQLEYEGFTSSEATYGVNNCGANWNEQAVKSAKSYLNVSSFSRQGLIEQLEYEGFTHEQAEYGVSQNGL